MSAADRLARVAACVRHGRECHEGVTRKGELQPCSKPAVALRDSHETDTYYPVCAYHARGFCIPLVDPDDAAALVAALRAVMEAIDKRGKQLQEALPPSLAALATPSYQFNVRASDVIRAIEEALA